VIPGIGNLEALVPLGVTFALITMRLTMLMATAPVLNSMMIPTRVKAVIIVLLSYIIHLGLVDTGEAPLDMLSLIIAAAGEAAIGATAGFSAAIIFAAADGAGKLIGIPMGLGFATIVDPMTRAQTVVTSQIFSLLMGLVFFVLDVHHLLIRMVTRSFEVIPPGQAIPSSDSAMIIVRSAGRVFEGAIQLAAPVLVVLLGTMVALGVLARVAPKINLFVLSFAVSIAVGLLALRAAMPQMLVWMKQVIGSIEPMTAQSLLFYR
jgi:flagellar biosynthetic protein FliR